VFTYSDTDPIHFEEPRSGIYPYLLVNIGSGVSIIKVSGPRESVRVGGTHLGGGTLWGVLSLLTNARTFDDMLGMAERGDNANVDMLVGDIYGTNYDKIGLKSTAIASTLGKVFRMNSTEPEREADGSQKNVSTKSLPFGKSPYEEALEARVAELETLLASAKVSDPGKDKWETVLQSLTSGNILHRDTEPQLNPHTGPALAALESSSPPFISADIARSLLYAISNNIGQIAYLQSEKHNLSTIYFGGSFIRGHRQTMNTLSYAIKFWSQGTKSAYFLRHEGFLGAVGAFLKRQPWNWGRRGSFEEGRPEFKDQNGSETLSGSKSET
jgi:type II pantothenate kinase